MTRHHRHQHRHRRLPHSWTTDPVNMSKKERIEWMRSTDAMRSVEYNLLDTLNRAEMIPNEWHQIWEDIDHRDVKRTRVTVSLDADVVRFFKAMGPGYQPRMNRVLRAFMHARLARIVDGPESQEGVQDPGRLLGPE